MHRMNTILYISQSGTDLELLFISENLSINLAVQTTHKQDLQCSWLYQYGKLLWVCLWKLLCKVCICLYSSGRHIARALSFDCLTFCLGSRYISMLCGWPVFHSQLEEATGCSPCAVIESCWECLLQWPSDIQLRLATWPCISLRNWSIKMRHMQCFFFV